MRSRAVSHRVRAGLVATGLLLHAILATGALGTLPPQARVALAFLVLLGRLYQLQILRGEEYKEKAEDNFVKEIRQPADPAASNGTLLSRFSFAIDVNEWGFRDLRAEAIERVRRSPAIGEIMRSPVWDAVLEGS